MALVQIGAPAIEPLVAALGSKSKSVRNEAGDTLDDLGWKPDHGEAGAAYWATKGRWGECVKIGAPAVQPLVASLEDRAKATRLGAANAHRQIGDANAALALVNSLKDMDGDVRAIAVDALDRVRDPRAVPPLVDALGYREIEVRNAAGNALIRLGAPAVYPLVAVLGNEQVRKAAVGALVSIGVPAVEALATALNAGDWGTRVAAVDALVQIGDPSAVEPLMVTLNDADWATRKIAAEALGKLGDPRAVDPLAAAQKDANKDVRKAAAEALGKLGDARAVEPLAAAQKDANKDVRKVAAEALGKLGDPSAVEPLAGALKDADRDVRKVAVEALGKLGDPRAVDPLVEILDDPNDPDSHDTLRRAACGALGELGALGVPRLIEALSDWRQPVRLAAVRALASAGDQRAVQPFVATLMDSDLEVRRAAVEALDTLGWIPDSSQSAASYWIVKGEWDRCMQVGSPALEPLLEGLTKQYSWSERKRAARCLVEIYQAGGLDAPALAAILRRRERITRRHEDYHHDRVEGCWTTTHSDFDVDEGVGVEFPI